VWPPYRIIAKIVTCASLPSFLGKDVGNLEIRLFQDLRHLNIRLNNSVSRITPTAHTTCWAMKYLLTSLSAVFLAHSAQAAITSFVENFDGHTLGSSIGSPWTIANSGAVSSQLISQLSPGDYGYTHALTASGTGWQTVNLGSGSDFVMSTTFRFDSLVTSELAGSMNISMTALGSNSSSTDGTSYRLNYVPIAEGGGNIQNYGKLILSKIGATGEAAMTTLSTTDRFIIPASNVGSTASFYTLQLTGTYSDSSIHLAGLLLDSNGNTLLSLSGDDASALSGEYFGTRFSTNRSTNYGTITYSEFAVTAIPEPTAAGLGALGVLGLLLRRRMR
jgi:hypothetical protein